MAENFDIALIGAGIVGLATARALSLRYPKLKLVILKKRIASPNIRRVTIVE